MKRAIFLLLFLLGITTTTVLAESTLPSIVPIPELQITVESLSQPNTFRLCAENTGQSDLLVIRPRVKMLDHLGSWGGWSIHVQGPGGSFQPFPTPGGIPPFTSLDLINLRPGELIGVILNVDRYIDDEQTALANMSGTYTINASYYLEQNNVFSGIDGNFITVPRLQPIKSNTLQFVVQ